MVFFAINSSLLVFAFVLTVGHQHLSVCSADESLDQPMASTLAFVPVQVFRNGSVKLADWDQIKVNTTNLHNAKLSNISMEDFQKDNRKMRERIKEDRLNQIKADILTRLGMVGRVPQGPMANVTASSLNGEVGRKIIDVVANAPPPSKSNLILEERQANESNGNGIGLGAGGSMAPGVGVTDANSNEFATSEIYAQRLQSFYPSCGIPNLTDPSVWKQPNQREMRMYFDLTIPKSSGGARRTHITIMWAKLRLYIFSGPECVKANSNSDTSTYDKMMQCDNQLTINLFQYSRPLQQNQGERRKMLESRIIPASYRGSVEFNMQSVIHAWQNAPDSNYGLAVRVEDSQGTSLPPALYLQQMNCSDPEIPIPNLADLYGEKLLNKTLVNGQLRARYPTLDLMSMETARDEQYYVTTLRGNNAPAAPQEQAFSSMQPSVPASPASLLLRLQAPYGSHLRTK